MPHTDIFAKTTQKTHEWLKEIAEHASLPDQHRALAVLRTTLHRLRDNLPLDVVAHVSAQLPLMIRGMLYENWHPSCCPVKDRKAELFLNAIEDQLYDYFPDVNVEKGVRAVFATLSNRLSEGEVTKLRDCLPLGIASLWELPL